MGFDAGDGFRSATILSINSTRLNITLAERNIFRIDGKLFYDSCKALYLRLVELPKLVCLARPALG